MSNAIRAKVIGCPDSCSPVEIVQSFGRQGKYKVGLNKRFRTKDFSQIYITHLLPEMLVT